MMTRDLILGLTLLALLNLRSLSVLAAPKEPPPAADGDLWAELSREAEQAWQQLLRCQGGNEEAAKAAYARGAQECLASNAVATPPAESLRALHQRVESVFLTAELSPKASFSVHPLLGQVVLEFVLTLSRFSRPCELRVEGWYQWSLGSSPVPDHGDWIDAPFSEFLIESLEAELAPTGAVIEYYDSARRPVVLNKNLKRMLRNTYAAHLALSGPSVFGLWPEKGWAATQLLRQQVIPYPLSQGIWSREADHALPPMRMGSEAFRKLILDYRELARRYEATVSLQQLCASPRRDLKIHELCSEEAP